jgi:hypothetical protein
MKKLTFLIISVSMLLRVRNVTEKFVKKNKRHSIFRDFFFRKSCRCRSCQATDDRMTHAHCMTDKTLRTRTQNIWFLIFHFKNCCTNSTL